MKMVLYLLRLSFRVALFDMPRNLFYAECLFDLAQLPFFFWSFIFVATVNKNCSVYFFAIHTSYLVPWRYSSVKWQKKYCLFPTGLE